MINGAAALAELIRPAGETREFGAQRALPVLPELSNLLPHRGLRRGSTVAIGLQPGPSVHRDALPAPSTGQGVPARRGSSGPAPGEVSSGSRAQPGHFADRGVTTTGGSTSLLLALLAAASSAGSWCAVVGVPTLGALAAAESGIALDRLALVPHPGPEWPTVVAALIDGVDVVVIAVPGPVSTSIAGRLVARARQRGCVLVPYGRWDGADVTLQVTQGRWEGLGAGHGRLRRRKVTVIARGRGTAARPKEVTMWMPGLTALPRDPAPRTPEKPRFRPTAVPPLTAADERAAPPESGPVATVTPITATAVPATPATAAAAASPGGAPGWAAGVGCA